MDYFYLAFTPTGGLNDLMLKTKFKPQKKFYLNLDVHSFSSQAPLFDPERTETSIDKQLGIETDLYFTHQPYETRTINGGYSQMFAEPSMELEKGGGSHEKLANWLWLSLTLKPKFISMPVKK